MSIANEILMHLRAIRNQKNEVSLYDPVGVDKEGNELTLLDLLGSSGEEISEPVEIKEETINLYCKLAVLNEKERYIIQLRFGLGDTGKKTQREIAKQLGISRSYVSRIEKKAVSKLLKAMKNEGR
ncbi:MAG: sigma-70 family RNA polymerase sigma factor [Clostridiales bacterium]